MSQGDSTLMAGSCSFSQCRTPSSLPHSLHGHFLKDSCCQVCGWTVDQQPGDVTCEAQVGARGGAGVGFPTAATFQPWTLQV